MEDKSSVSKNDVKKSTTARKTKKAASVYVPQESVYTVEELAAGAKQFNEKYEVVKAALIVAGKESATIKETEKIVKEFKERKVV